MCCQITLARTIRQRGFGDSRCEFRTIVSVKRCCAADCAPTILDSFANVARTPVGIVEVVDVSQSHEQDFFGGRCGTRTHDLSRVKAAL
jgi:hypothetical protein